MQKRYIGNRIRFTGDEGSGAHSSTTRSDAEDEAKRYPQGMALRVYYDPADPGEAVLEPGLAHYEALQLYGPGLFVLLALALAVIVPLAIRRGARNVVASLAEMSPCVWEVAAGYGVLPPADSKGLAPEPVQQWPVETRHTVRLKGRQVTFEIGPCRAHTEGDFTGNLDLTLRTSPVLPMREIADNLRLRWPNRDVLLSVVGSGETRQGLELTFSFSDIASDLTMQHGEDTFDFVGLQREMAAALTAVDVLWGADVRKHAMLPADRMWRGPGIRAEHRHALDGQGLRPFPQVMAGVPATVPSNHPFAKRASGPDRRPDRGARRLNCAAGLPQSVAADSAPCEPNDIWDTPRCPGEA